MGSESGEYRVESQKEVNCVSEPDPDLAVGSAVDYEADFACVVVENMSSTVVRLAELQVH